MQSMKIDLGVDVVSRQAVIDLMMQKWCENFSGDDAMQESIDAIREMPSAAPQEPRWIPVSDYLPVTNDEVLVTYIVNGNAKKRYVETANCFDGEWSSVNDEYRIPNTKIEIIAWCEMPKPYKAESEDKDDKT